MMDLGNNSVCKECTMICMDVYSDDEDKEIAVYGDQGVTQENMTKICMGT